MTCLPADRSRRKVLAAAGGAAVGIGLGALAQRTGPRAGAAALLRPPGAGSEAQFLAACIRCGQCVEACPFDTLRLTGLDHGFAAATPYAVAREVPCYLCQGWDEPLCIKLCPTDALRPVGEITEIRMGTAVIDSGLCLAFNDTVCRACWHACPFPNDAIELNARLRPVVNEATCTGCGLCEHACPTEPSSIVVEPASARRRAGATS